MRDRPTGLVEDLHLDAGRDHREAVPERAALEGDAADLVAAEKVHHLRCKQPEGTRAQLVGERRPRGADDELGGLDEIRRQGVQKRFQQMRQQGNVRDAVLREDA